MSSDEFTQQIEKAYLRLEDLQKRASRPEEQRASIPELMESLSTALEELHVAGAELQNQNEELIAARHSIETERQRYQEMFEFAPDGYLVTDAEGVIRESNRAAAILLGVSQEFLVGKPFSVFVSTEDHPRLYRNLGRLSDSTETLKDWDVRLRPRERPPFPASVTIGVAQDVAGRVIGMRWLVRDITERKHTEEQLRSARDQLRALAAHEEVTREEERSSIARESREELAQILAILKIDLAWVSESLKQNLPALRIRVEEMLKLVDIAMKSALQIAGQSRPASLDDLGLMAAIAWQAHEFQGRTGIPCQLISSLRELELDQERRTTVYRIFQEALADVARQASATCIIIKLQVKEECLILTIKDDGTGIPERAGTSGESLGLLGMQERAYRLGGDVSVSSLADAGTTVTVRIPLH
jgi:PAS domain S-box-containing protein